MTMQFDSVGLQEMSHEETQELNGGLIWLPAALIALAVSAINNFGDIREGFSDGNSGKPPRH